MNRFKEHYEWLINGKISSNLKVLGIVSLYQILQEVNVKVPYGCIIADHDNDVYDDSAITYDWDNGDLLVNLEIYEDKACEWFWRNRVTEEYGGDDWFVGQPIPKDIIELLKNFKV